MIRWHWSVCMISALPFLEVTTMKSSNKNQTVQSSNESFSHSLALRTSEPSVKQIGFGLRDVECNLRRRHQWFWVCLGFIHRRRKNLFMFIVLWKYMSTVMRPVYKKVKKYCVRSALHQMPIEIIWVYHHHIIQQIWQAKWHVNQSHAALLELAKHIELEYQLKPRQVFNVETHLDTSTWWPMQEAAHDYPKFTGS